MAVILIGLESGTEVRAYGRLMTSISTVLSRHSRDGRPIVVHDRRRPRRDPDPGHGLAAGDRPLDRPAPVDGRRRVDLRPRRGGRAELGRLAAAEYACCSFFEFTLTVGPDGMAFAVAAPPEASAVVTAMFGDAS
jgi:hypothetical protein